MEGSLQCIFFSSSCRISSFPRFVRPSMVQCVHRYTTILWSNSIYQSRLKTTMNTKREMKTKNELSKHTRHKPIYNNTLSAHRQSVVLLLVLLFKQSPHIPVTREHKLMYMHTLINKMPDQINKHSTANLRMKFGVYMCVRQ